MHQIGIVKLQFQDGRSNKYYDVVFYLKKNGYLVLTSEYGRIGSAPKNGVGGTFEFDAKQHILDGTLGSKLQKLVSEADVIVKSKLAKGYTPKGASSFNVVAMRTILENILNVSTPAPSASKKAKDTSLPVERVEVIDMCRGIPKVAKVLADFNFEVLGNALNPQGKTVRIGDVVDVCNKNGEWVIN